MTRTTPARLTIALVAVLPFAVLASTPANDPAPASPVAVDTDAMALAEFDALVKMAANHPNELYRLYANRDAANGHWAQAARNFRAAARYSDKYSQHRLSMLFWHGVGVRRDRVEAYIWADLAAERGYPQFLAIREKMWAELTPAEQAEVPVRGAPIVAEFGDHAAKPRFARAVAQGLRQRTGSRTGFDTGSVITAVGPGNQLFGSVGGVNLSRMFEASRTDPDQYWAFEDRVWKTAVVEVGEVEELPAGAKPDAAPDAKPEPTP